MRRGTIALVVLAVLAATGSWAHELRPAYLELKETTRGVFRVTWKVPLSGDQRPAMEPVLPPACTPTGERTAVLATGARVERWTVRCAGGLGGRLRIDGLEATPTDAMVRIEWADGRRQTLLLQSASPSAEIGAGGGGATPALGFLRLGVEHILLGPDHLLFVLGLLLIVRDRWTLLKTVTAFTVAHSITLAIATLGYASAPLPPLNAAIAMSILFLGPEIVRSWRGETSLTLRNPWVVAFAFGLLHGFGFASGLKTLGLPRAEIPLALLLFNVGVELGQIGFVLLIVALERSFRVLEIRWPQWVERMPGYAVGSLGAYWTIQRTLVLLGTLR